MNLVASDNVDSTFKLSVRGNCRSLAVVGWLARRYDVRQTLNCLSLVRYTASVIPSPWDESVDDMIMMRTTPMIKMIIIIMIDHLG